MRFRLREMGFFPIRLTLPTWTVGEMSEWFKEHAWKACVQETVPRVRIPLSPPFWEKQIGETAGSESPRVRRKEQRAWRWDMRKHGSEGLEKRPIKPYRVIDTVPAQPSVSSASNG